MQVVYTLRTFHSNYVRHNKNAYKTSPWHIVLLRDKHIQLWHVTCKFCNLCRFICGQLNYVQSAPVPSAAIATGLHGHHQMALDCI